MSSSFKHRDLLIINGYVLLVLVMGALLTPALYFPAQAVIQGSPEGWLARVLEGKEFPSYFNRAVLLAALVGMPMLLKTLRMSWRDITGAVPWSTGWKQMSTTFALALISVAALAWTCLEFGVSRPKSDPNYYKFGSALASGLTVSFLEEFIFRGAVLGILCRSLGLGPGLWWTTLFFSILHFLKPPLDGAMPHDSIHWLSGFWVITQLFRGFGLWQNVVGEFLVLFAVGWSLGKVRLISGGLWLSIGLHAGWVFGMKYFGSLVSTTRILREGEWSPWLVRNTCRAIVSPVVGVFPLIIIFLTGLVAVWIAIRWSKHHSKAKAKAALPEGPGGTGSGAGTAG